MMFERDSTSSDESSQDSDSRQLNLQQNYQYLKNVMKRFLRKDLISYIEVDKDVSANFRTGLQNMTKDDIIEQFITDISNLGYNLTSYTESLDLIQVHRYSYKQNWTVYSLKNLSDNSLLRRHYLDLEDDFNRVINDSNVFKYIKCKMYEEGIWCRIPMTKIPRNAITLPCIYMVFFPGLPFVMITKMHKVVTSDFLQVLKTLFQAGIVEPMKLFSTNISSLLQLAIQSKNYALLIDENHVPSIIKNKLKTNENQFPEIPDFINLNKTGKIQTRSYTRQVFGKYEQPVIKQLAFLSTTRFYGVNIKIDKTSKVDMAMGFKGENVLQGLRELVEKGHFENPLPNYMEDLPLNAHNAIRITDF